MVPGVDSAQAAPQDAAWRVVALTALAYSVVGWLALGLAVPPGFASPLYPSAGIALAAVLIYGRTAIPGVALGSFLVNVVLSAARGQLHAAAVGLPLMIGVGAGLQAAFGAWLVRRWVPWPLTLAGPRDIARFGLFGVLACLVNPTLATLVLRQSGAIDADQVAANWGTWWVGDTLGTLIGAPLALTLIGRPAEDWVPRRRTVGIPLLMTTLLLGVATLVVRRWDAERLQANFERDADRMAAEVDARLTKPMHALQALHSAYLAGGGLTSASLQAAMHWWLSQPLELQSLGLSQRVPRNELPAFEARARAEGLPGYHVFDRDGPVTGDAEVVAVRLIAPLEGNASALGVNSLSVPAARAAVERTRDTGEPAASAGFRLTQSAVDETGLVIYQALYDGRPADQAARRAAMHALVFVTVRAERLMAGLSDGERHYLHWCLVDLDPAPVRPRLAGAPGCEAAIGDGFSRRRKLTFAAREFELRVTAAPGDVPGHEGADAWLFSVAGMVAAAMLGALLLTVTGRARRIEQAVDERTAELRRQVQDRVQAEAALRDGEARLRSILDNVPIGVMFLDLQGRIVETNPRLCELLDRPAPLLLRSTLAEISHVDEHAENLRQLSELLAGEASISRRQMRLLRADGSALWVRVHISALRDERGQATRLAGTVEDISEHLRLEASERALDLAEAASRTKSEFVSRMSHELRTPLNAMIGFAQLLGLDRQPPLAQHQLDWSGQIQRAGWHLLEMINETLDLARIESGSVHLALRPVHVAAMVAACLSMVSNAARQRGVVMHEALSPAAPMVTGDEMRLKQVLTNLLSNAVKYNVEGGSVVVGSVIDAQGQVEITVRDSGLGMSPEQMAALFQPYNRLGRESSSIEGTGIGLVISRRLAELMGGTLQAASVAGQGSVFTLRLPRADVGAPVAARASDRLHGPQRVVHYIEDNETNVEIMRGILAQRPQIELEVSTMGLDGLSAIRRRRPDLILLDMQLPDISGLELLRHLKQDDDVADIPVVVVSADATTARMQEALTLGAAHYMTKPVDIVRFLQTLDEVLEALETRWGL